MDKSLTDKQQAFIENFVVFGDHIKAATLAGYKSPEVQGRELRRKLAGHIEEEVREVIGGHVPMALKTVAELAESAEQPAVRLKASSEILSRAGLDAAQKVEQKNIDSLENKATGDLMQQLSKILGRGVVEQGTECQMASDNSTLSRDGKGENNVSSTPSHTH